MFVSLRRRELKYRESYINGSYAGFVSSRRRELKWNTCVPLATAFCVRLLTETWVEMGDRQVWAAANLSSSPYGDVSWNKDPNEVLAYLRKVRLLAETWIEITRIFSLRYTRKIVHPRKGMWIEISSKDEEDDQETRSSPCGDVNWNRSRRR